jgi:glutamate--cysteine ligase
MKQIVDRINQKYADIHTWLTGYEGSKELPLYSSVDIRDAGFKMSVVDTNLFPAGFNNLCEHGIEDAKSAFKEAALKRVPDCRNVLVLAEEHTRNTWYLENLRILESIIKGAGFCCKVATFLKIEPAFCSQAAAIELETATGQSIKLWSIDHLLQGVCKNNCPFDLIIMNNDLTTGIPEVLKGTCAPIYPSIQAGWHARLKSHHFEHAQDLINEFANMIDFDPWLLSCLDRVADNININEADDRQRLQDTASDLFKEISLKYQEHGIDSKPFIFLKADSGTYGMGVLPIEDPSDLSEMNRRNRNKLYKGKSSQVITRYLLQEGVPSIQTHGDQVAEACLYQISNVVVGGFYRMHENKNTRENLNSKGMTFKAICPHEGKYGDCGIHTEKNQFDVYRIMARIAGIAAHREIVELEIEMADPA